MRSIATMMACALLLGACANLKYIISEYQGIEVQTVQMSDDNYRIFDKPSANKLMITPSLGASGAEGFTRGLTLGAVDGMPSKPVFQAAVEEYLKGTERQSCRVMDGYLLQRPQWEFKYDCTPERRPR